MKTYALITLQGGDAHDYAHRMFSRNFKKLGIDEGALTLFLSAEGRVQSLFWAIKIQEGLRILVPEGQAAPLIELIERYHFAEKFVVQRSGISTAKHSPSHSSVSGFGRWENDRFHGDWRGLHFEFIPHDLGQPAAQQDDEVLRLENLVAEFGMDFDSTTLVFETGLDELCDPNKGCYIGQEVVERVRSRGGQANRKLALFEWNDEPPHSPTDILNSTGEKVGISTRSKAQRADSKWLGLGYLRRGAETHAGGLRLGTISGALLRSI